MMSQTNIFQSMQSFTPLAHKLRPSKLEDLVGSIKTNPIFQNWLKNGASQSALFWGPPGTGKTTIAEMAANLSDREFTKLYAFDSGVKDLREVISRAKLRPGSIILFVDEVHNFNKSQQDILLNAIETGLITFIGATTENPAVSINKALLSRILKFELKAHRYSDLALLVDKAAQISEKTISPEAKDYLIKASYGDARVLLTSFDMALHSIGLNEDEENEYDISLKLIKIILEKKYFSGDANSYYDCVSALQKSLRGSDVNASLYWLARLLHGGAELEQVARRILVTASEDVGLADPQALVVANAAYEAALKLGMPEARIPLAQAVCHIAMAPKSNASYMALSRAMHDCSNHPPYEVPYHLRPFNSSCPAKNLKNKEENPISKYKYPHDYPGHWVEQDYLPEELKNKKYFK